MKRFIYQKLLIILLCIVLFSSVNAVAKIIEIGPPKKVSIQHFPAKVQLRFNAEKIPANLESPEQHIHVAYFNGIHWIRLPQSDVQPSKQLVEVTISHSGEYRVVCQTENYGLKISEDQISKDGKYLLLIPDIATSQETWRKLKKYFSSKGYSFLEFDYRPGERVEDAAKRLSVELKKMHQTSGDFRFNIIAMGVGGLIANYYYVQDELFHHDIDKLIVCLGTPYRGSQLADLKRVSELHEKLMRNETQNEQPVHQLFSFYDALGAIRDDLKQNSHIMEKITKIPKYRFEDSIRVESFSGIKPLALGFQSKDVQKVPELIQNMGDGYVSLESSRWTPIERVPFELDHYELPKSIEVFKSIEKFLELEQFNWTILFKMISKPEIRKKIARLWHQEINLYYQDPRSIEFFINYNQNVLRSVPQDALLFTNGDMDTFPALYLQEIENFRKDVAVINLSLFNLPEYIKYSKHAYQMPTGLSDAEIETLKFIKNDREFIQSGEIRIPLTDKKILRVQDLMLINVVENNKWQRPVYFAVTVMKHNLLFPEEYFQIEGLVKRLYAEQVSNRSNPSAIIDNFFNKFTFKGPFDKHGNLKPETEPFINSLATNYIAPILMLAHDEIESRNYKKAQNYLNFAKRFKSIDSDAILNRIEKLLASKKGEK